MLSSLLCLVRLFAANFSFNYFADILAGEFVAEAMNGEDKLRVARV